MHISGPGKFSKGTHIWRRYVRPTILEGRMQTSDGQTYILQENKVSIELSPTKIYVYHSYSYLNNGTLTGGRWYNLNMPLTSFAVLPENTFTIDLSNFPSDEPVTPQPTVVTLVFTRQFTKQIKARINSIMV